MLTLSPDGGVNSQTPFVLHGRYVTCQDNTGASDVWNVVDALALFLAPPPSCGGVSSYILIKVLLTLLRLGAL